MKFGAIDIGTNAARLLIGEIGTKKGKHFVKRIAYTRVPLRLGTEVFSNGKLTERKVDDLVKTVHAFKLISELYEVRKLRAVATSALREAVNSEIVIQRIKEETEVTVEIISGQDEAALVFGTFSISERNNSNPFIVVDVGGGSTEISVFEGSKPIASGSFEIGSVRLLMNKVSEDQWKELQDWISSHICLDQVASIYGVGGNINKVHKLLAQNSKGPISLKKMKKLKSELDELTIEQRMNLFQLKPDRADVIVPALTIYIHILEQLQSKRVYVPRLGLADGMVLKMYQEEQETN